MQMRLSCAHRLECAAGPSCRLLALLSPEQGEGVDDDDDDSGHVRPTRWWRRADAVNSGPVGARPPPPPGRAGALSSPGLPFPPRTSLGDGRAGKGPRRDTSLRAMLRVTRYPSGVPAVICYPPARVVSRALRVKEEAALLKQAKRQTALQGEFVGVEECRCQPLSFAK